MARKGGSHNLITGRLVDRDSAYKYLQTQRDADRFLQWTTLCIGIAVSAFLALAARVEHPIVIYFVLVGSIVAAVVCGLLWRRDTKRAGGVQGLEQSGNIIDYQVGFQQITPGPPPPKGEEEVPPDEDH